MSFLRKKNTQRKRIIYRFSLEEKMLMQYMAFVLHDFDHIYEDSVFFRLGRHISRIFRDIRKNNYSHTHWVLKTDIKSYVGSGGKRNNAKYRVRYKTMRRLGYRTLVHAFYHGIDRDI